MIDSATVLTVEKIGGDYIQIRERGDPTSVWAGRADVAYVAGEARAK